MPKFYVESAGVKKTVGAETRLDACGELLKFLVTNEHPIAALMVVSEYGFSDDIVEDDEDADELLFYVATENVAKHIGEDELANVLHSAIEEQYGEI